MLPSALASHQVEGQSGDQHPAAKGHDRRHQSLDAGWCSLPPFSDNGPGITPGSSRCARYCCHLMHQGDAPNTISVFAPIRTKYPDQQSSMRVLASMRVSEDTLPESIKVSSLLGI